MKNSPRSLLTMLAAAVVSLGRNMMFRGAVNAVSPPSCNPQTKQGGGKGGAGTTLPKKKRWHPPAQTIPPECMHGHRRAREHQFDHGTIYVGRSRHVGCGLIPIPA